MLEVDEIVRETSDSAALYFNAHNEIKDFYPGQFLTFVLKLNGKEIRRSYSICTSPSSLPRIGVCVKRVKKGLGSNYILDKIKEGDKVKLLEPYGSFNLNHRLDQFPPLVLFGAGSGITPLMSILKSALEKATSKVYLFYGNSKEEGIIFKEELHRLKKLYGERLDGFHILSRPGDNWIGRTGRLSQELCAELLDEFNLLQDKSVNFYVCGPKGMMDSVLECLDTSGIEQGRVHRESFFSGTSEYDIVEGSVKRDTSLDEAPDERTVKLIYDGEEHEVVVPKGEYILDCALDAGIDLPYACQSGICGMCRAEKVKGEMLIHDQEALSESEIADGACITCCAEPLSDDLVIDYDQ